MNEHEQALVTQIISQPMATLFAKPRRIESGEAAKVYLRQFSEAIASIRPNRDELEHVWQQIRMDPNQKTWPLPGEVCERIQRFRAKQSTAEKRFESHVETIDEPLTPAQEAEFKDCVRRLRANPEQYRNGGALLRMAEHFERR